MMKATLKRTLTIFLSALILISVLGVLPVGANAAAKKLVMTITATGKYNSDSMKVYAKKDSSGYYNFSLQKQKLSLLKKSKTETVKISVTVNDPSIICEETLRYSNKITAKNYTSIDQDLDFEYYLDDGETDSDSISYEIYLVYAEISVESLAVATTSKGFNPSKGNYLTIRTGIRAYADNGSASVRIRILKKSGKYVYQRKVKKYYGLGLLQLKWNGKASKKNSAGVKAKSYVKPGTYYVEIFVKYKDSGYKFTDVKKKKFVISKKASTGATAVSKSKQLPIYTGYSKIDYIAEQMLKSAKVTKNLSTQEKVRRIYHWMTVNFKYAQSSEGSKYKTYYKINKLQSKIDSYEKKSNKKYKNKKILYNYSGSYELTCMKKRIGVCNDHAEIFMILCNHAGVDAGVCSGNYLNLSGSAPGHAWNYAVVNGKVYYYDVDVELLNYKKGQGDYYWYMKTESEAKKNHRFSTNPVKYSLIII